MAPSRVVAVSSERVRRWCPSGVSAGGGVGGIL